MSHPFVFRPGSTDEQVFGGVIYGNEYRLPDAFGPDDIVLDIGAHIGSFCFAALERGANHVHGFEPFSKNYDCARQNLASYQGRVTLYNQAVWRSDRVVKTLSFTSFEGENESAGHVIDANRGEPVEAVSFDEVVLRLTDNGKKRIRLMKIDCEGSEFPILFTSKTLHLIDSITGEYHNFADNYDYGPGEDHFFHKMPEHAKVEGHDRYIHEDIAAKLRESGFDVETIPCPHIPTIAGWFHASRPQAAVKPIEGSGKPWKNLILKFRRFRQSA